MKYLTLEMVWFKGQNVNDFSGMVKLYRVKKCLWHAREILIIMGSQKHCILMALLDVSVQYTYQFNSILFYSFYDI